MSAFLCSKRLILNLAANSIAYSDLMQKTEPEIESICRDNLAILWDANTRSLAARYGDTPELMPNLSSREIVSLVRDVKQSYTSRFGINTKDAAQLVEDAHCFDYQSCEFDGYREHPAYAMVRNVVWRQSSALAKEHTVQWGS